jgi:hypothetical protein
LYFDALTAHLGAWFAVPATGKLTWRVALALLDGPVKKSYRRRKIFKVERRRQLGQREDLPAALQGMGITGTLNTAFVERINLTRRHALAALTRRAWATAQLSSELEAHLDWWRAYYHFARPHASLRQPLGDNLARRTRQRFRPRTPAQAAGLTDHRWTVQELLAYPAPPLKVG